MKQSNVKTRLAVDVGGTFTDVVLERGGQRVTTKVLTTHAAPERGALEGIRQLLKRAAVAASEIGTLIHGTTLATNAIIERKGARTALITTAGFRDSVEMAYENRFEQYDINMERPQPLVPRNLRYTVRERMDARGNVLLPLEVADVEALASVLLERGVSSVAIGFLHSYANPDHELAARDVLLRRTPGISVTLSAEICPEIREYDRLSTACTNAYIQPLMVGYLERFGAALREMGLRCPVFMMLSGGGITTLDIAIKNPIRLVESGPAGGAILGGEIARQCDLRRVLAFDMGGTTAKICLIDDFQPETSRSFEVARAYRFLKGSGLPLRIPVIEMVEIGAGGGSIGALDSLKRVQVGPESAGSEPGPACYGRGGDKPTVTDADLVLDRIDPVKFAGGRYPLQPAKAAQAIERAIAAPLRMSAAAAAFGIIEIVDENMANAARVHGIERGKSMADRTLIVTGGAAPLHAARLAEKLDIDTVIVPTNAGVGSAIGFLHAPVAYEVVRTLYQRLDSLDVAAVNRVFDDMRREAEDVIAQGATGPERAEAKHAYMRYVGQGHEISVQLPSEELAADVIPELKQRFDERYRALYGRVIPNLAVEILSWTLYRSEVKEDAPHREIMPEPFEAPVRGEARESVSTYLREELSPGARMAGPAIITEDETAIVVSESFDARVDQHGYVVLTKKAGAGRQADNRQAVAEINLQTMWNRLLAVVEEQAQTLVRTAFSTAAREAGDLSAAIFLPDGRMLAQAVTGTPGHVNSMAESIRHFLRKFPVETMRPGDAFLSNDPWLAAGHLHDVVVITPAFLEGKVVALFGSTCHVVDIGGLGLGIEGRQIYHEGLYIPIMPLLREGRINESLIELVRANVREPRQVEGDLYALAACNDTGVQRLAEMMSEYRISSMQELGEFIIERSRQAMLEAIRRVPPGRYRNRMTIDGVEKPIELVATLTVSHDGILVDYEGTSALSFFGINVPLVYAKAYTSFGLHCVIAPTVPRNYGSLEPIQVTAPEGCILNPKHPAAVSARHMVGQMLPDTVLGCLHQALPAPAEGTSCVWTIRLSGGPGVAPDDPGARASTPFNVASFHSGGCGARPTKDGLSATAFPSGVKNVPVEITESISPLIFWKKEYRTDSGGAGKCRGGLGQVIEVESTEHAPLSLAATFDRVVHPPRGRNGGAPGLPGRLTLSSGVALKGMGRQTIPGGTRLVVEFPGGGGHGDPHERDPRLVAADFENELISPQAAREKYAVALNDDGSVDLEQTQRLRQRPAVAPSQKAPITH